MKDKIKEQLRKMQERNIKRVFIPNGDFRRLEILINQKIEETKKAEREMVLEGVKLVLNLYPHKSRDELFAEIVEYLNEKEIGK